MANFQTNAQGFPNVSSPFTDPKTGIIQQCWQQLLSNLWNRTGGGKGDAPGPFVTIPVGSSNPFIYTATAPGHLWVSPGTYSETRLNRGGTILNFGYITRGIFPMSLGDTISLSFTTLPPTVYFI